MKILIFGGTTEGRELARKIPELYGTKHSVTVCVATDVGAFELGGIPGTKVLVGRKSAEEMAELARSFDLIVDATHPYAVEASANIRRAAEMSSTRLVRLMRETGGPQVDDDIIYVSSAEQAAGYLAEREGRILLVTGAKELGAFAQIQRERLYVRVLPTAASLAACDAEEIPYRNIIAMVGPFLAEMNAATIRQYGISFVVTKDSGRTGGFGEKIEACLMTGAEAVVIARPRESGLSMEEVLALLE